MHIWDVELIPLQPPGRAGWSPQSSPKTMVPATFAYCRLGSPFQKYTSLYYTKEARGVLDALDGPSFQCMDTV